MKEFLVLILGLSLLIFMSVVTLIVSFKFNSIDREKDCKVMSEVVGHEVIYNETFGCFMDIEGRWISIESHQSLGGDVN